MDAEQRNCLTLGTHKNRREVNETGTTKNQFKILKAYQRLVID